MTSIKTTLLMGAFVALLASPAAAQSKYALDFTPHVGVLAPLSDVVEAGAFSAGSPAAAHDVNLLLGGMLTYWWAQEWGIELGVMYAPNSIESEAFGIPGTIDASFLTVTGRLVYDFGQNPAKPAVLLTGGLGFFATDYDDPLSMKTGGLGLVGLGLRIPISARIALRVDLDDYITTTNWELPAGGETDKLLQNDLTIKGGLTFSFGAPVR